MTKPILPSLSTLKKHHVELPYNTIVNIYHKRHFDEKIFDPLINTFAVMLAKKAYVLDAGCATGGETQKLLSRSFQVISIDIADQMLSRAKVEVPQGDFRKMDLMHLTFPADTFDGIWCARSLIHVPSSQLDKTIEGFYKVLKDGGVACITVLGGETEAVEPEYYDETGNTSTFFKYFSARELEDLLKRHQFNIIKTIISFRKGENEPHITVFASKN